LNDLRRSDGMAVYIRTGAGYVAIDELREALEVAGSPPIAVEPTVAPLVYWAVLPIGSDTVWIAEVLNSVFGRYHARDIEVVADQRFTGSSEKSGQMTMEMEDQRNA